MTSKQQRLPSKKLFPLTYVLKYDPPMIGMIYKLSETDKKKRIYKIYLHGLMYKNDPELITRQLFREHALHIDETNVSHEQVKNLVTKLLQEKGKKSEPTIEHKKELPTKQQTHKEDVFEYSVPKGSDKMGMYNQGFEQYKNRPQMNNYDYQEEEEDEEYYRKEMENDHLDFEGEIDDMENDDHEFEYDDNYGHEPPQQEKKNINKLDFLNNVGNQQAKKGDEMDFILDDPDNLDNFSDY